MEKIKLTVKQRESKTPNQLRRDGSIPATLYGPGAPSENLQLDAREFSRLPAAAYSHMIELEQEAKGKTNAVIRHVQRRATSQAILNVELYRVALDRALTMTVPLKFVGVSPAVQEGGQLIENFVEAEVECLPNDIPDFIEVDLSQLKEIDQSLHFKDLKVSSKVRLLHPTDEIVVKVIAPRAAEVVEEAPAVEAAPAEAAAPA